MRILVSWFSWPWAPAMLTAGILAGCLIGWRIADRYARGLVIWWYVRRNRGR